MGEVDRRGALAMHPNRRRLGPPDAHRETAGHRVRAEHPVGVVVVARRQEGEVGVDRRDAHASTTNTCAGVAAGSRRM